MSGVAWHHILLLFYHHFNSFMQNLQKKVWIFENLTNMLRISFKLAHCTAAIFSSLLSAARTEQNLAISADLRPGAVTHTRQGSWCYTYLHPATVDSVYSTQPRDWAANLTTLWSQPCQSSSGKLSSGPVQSFSEHASNFFIVFVAQLSPLSL